MHRLVLVFLFLMTAGYAAELAELPAMTPLYPSPSVLQQPSGYLKESLECRIAERKTERIDRHPVSADVELVRLEGKQPLWAAPAFVVQPDSTVPVFRRNTVFRNLAGGLLIAALLLLWTGAKKKISETAVFPLVLVLFHCALLFFFRSGTCFFSCPVDEKSYFREALDLSEGSFKGPWLYTVGWPLIQTVMILISGWTSFPEAEMFLCYFNGFFVMSLVIFFSWFVLWKMFRSPKTAFLSILLWRIAVLFLRFRDFWTPDGKINLVSKSFFALPDRQNAYYVYMDCISSGFNGLSDTVSVLSLLAVMTLLFSMKAGAVRSLIAGALFGFSCLIRINNILFLPLVLCVELRDMSDWKTGLRRTAGAAVTFLCIFSLQLAVNQVQFGSWLTFPYILHTNNAAKGFLFSAFPTGVRFLTGANLFFFTAGCTGLLFLQNSRERLFLTLWTVPAILFFCGYPETGNNGVRFLLPVYAALCGAFVRSIPVRRNIPCVVLSCLLCLQVLLTAPSGYGYTKLLPWNMEKLSSGPVLACILAVLLPAAVLIAAALFRKEKRTAFFAVLFSACYASGLSWLPIILFCVSLFREMKNAAVFAGKQLRSRLFRRDTFL